MVTDKENTKKARPEQDKSFADKFSDEARTFAKKVHEQKVIYLVFGCLDGLSLSYSTLKYFFDLYLIDSHVSVSDYMHDWMLSPEGIALTALESISLIAFSIMGNYFSDDDKNPIKRYSAILWPYCRNVLKASKNAFKGWRSMLKIIEVLGGANNLNFLLLPVSLTLGIVGIINRCWAQYMITQRKKMMKANKDRYKEILESNFITEEQAREHEKKILENGQSTTTRVSAFFSAALGGTIDSLYLYLGIPFVASLSTPLFIFVVAASFLFSVSCIVTRVYEEYEYQRRLVETQELASLALYCKLQRPQLLEWFKRLRTINSELKNKNLTLEERCRLLEEQQEIYEHVNAIEKELGEKRDALKKLIRPSYTTAFLTGLRHGLAAYGMLASMLFATATIMFLASASFPPLALLIIVLVGLVSVIGFIAHAMINHYRHNSEEDKAFAVFTNKLKANKGVMGELDQMEEEINSDLIVLEIDDAIEASMRLDPSPQFFYQEWLEVLRSFFSGLGKGSKSVDFTLNPLQEQDSKAHYHDTPVMLGITAVSVIVYSLALAIRALARGFGKEPPGILNNMEKIHASIRKSKSQPDLKTWASDSVAEDEMPNSSNLPHSKSMFSFFARYKKPLDVELNDFMPMPVGTP